MTVATIADVEFVAESPRGLQVVDMARVEDIEGPGGHHHAVAADLHVALGKGIVAAAGLEGGDQVVGVAAHHRGVLENPDVGGCQHPLRQIAGTLVKGLAVGGGGDAVVEAASQMGARLQQHHALARLGGGQGGGHAGGPAADDGDLRFHEPFVVLALHLVVG